MTRFVAFAVFTLAASSAAGDAASPLVWRSESGFSRAADASAAAIATASGSVALGDARGVWLLQPGASARRVLRSGPVRDLAFDAEGLWAATDRGLYRVAQGRVESRGPAPGKAREVRRVLATPIGVFAATADGIFYARDGRSFAPLDGHATDGDTGALVWRPEAEAPLGTLFAVIGGRLLELPLAASGVSLRAASAAEVALPESGGGVLDLALAPHGEVVALRRRSLARRTASGWEPVAAPLPPGAEPLRIAFGAGAVWLASETGLLRAPALGDAFERVPEVGGAISALATDARRVVAAGARGAYIAAEPSTSATSARRFQHPDEPSVLAVQHAALRHQQLGIERANDLSRRAARRGFLPTLELGGVYAGGRAGVRDWDEVFTSGEQRLLFDHSRDRGRDFGVDAALRWDLGDAAFDPEEIDASKERRELIELRDEVLDEVGQLYFERMRVLVELAALADSHGPDAARLALRADELGAGLDAWTGGWWSQRVVPRFPLAPPGPAQEP